MIKPLTAEHLDAFIRIRLDSLKLHPDAFGAAYEEGLDREKTREELAQKNEENFILGYFQDEELIGMVGSIRDQRLKKKHKATIWCVFVYPAYRGQGIARQLMMACIEKLEKLPGLERIVLTVSHQATSAQKLYESLGFKAFGREPEALKTHGHYVDEIYMSRKSNRTNP